MAKSILLADDDTALRRVMQFKLKQRGFETTAVEDGRQALAALKKSRYDLLLSDMRMPGMNGLQLLDQARNVQPDLQVILITAYAEISQAVKAVKLGAFDYLTKPFEDEELFVAIDKALKFRRLEDENKFLKEQLRNRDFLKQVVGISQPFRELMQIIDKIGPTDATVLISGESGTGKELAARAIHHKSLRGSNSFVAVNCAAIPRDLLESELFGHVRGAFTGAVKDKKGKFELANGGTLLLDEISELNIELQAKLLRAIQERVVEPVGSEKKIEIDVRLIAASNLNLKERVHKGAFREDLFYRLNVIPIHVPALRERREDIPILIKEFLQKFGAGQKIKIADELVQVLVNYNWPGNIRELENLIERMVILRKSDLLSLDDLPDDFENPLQSARDDTRKQEPERLTFHEAEKKLIVEALDKSAWNKSKAAKYLSIPRHILIYRMKKYNIFQNNPLR